MKQSETTIDLEYPETTVLTSHIRCALADLIGAYLAHVQGDSNIHDWKAHLLSITDLANDLGEDGEEFLKQLPQEDS